MKKELNLTKLNKMSEKELKNVKGGNVSVCCCACAWVNCGGSSTSANGGKNAETGLSSPGIGLAC